MDLPVSTKIQMRPVWRRRQKRAYFSQTPLDPPTREEKLDALRVIEDPDNLRFAPALFAEAELILLEEV